MKKKLELRRMLISKLKLEIVNIKTKLEIVNIKKN